MVDVVAPVSHEYDIAPPAVNTVDAPEQMVALLTAIIGIVFTVTVVVVFPVQPDVSPVTE